jgi:hypothetical protein
MDMEVVEKGVETEEQMSMFCLKGCGLLQGYLFSQPVQANRAVSLLRNAALDNALVALSSRGRSVYLARLKRLVLESGIETKAEASLTTNTRRRPSDSRSTLCERAPMKGEIGNQDGHESDDNYLYSESCFAMTIPCWEWL